MKKKKMLSLILAMIMCVTTGLSLSACGENGGGSSGGDWHEAASKEEVFNCSYKHLWGNGYIGIDNYVEQLTQMTPDNNFAALVAEAYDQIDKENLNDVETDILNCLVLLPNYFDMTQETNVEKIWCVGYENGKVAFDERWILIEVSGTDHDRNTTGTQYWGFTTYQWDTGVNSGELGYIALCDYTADIVKEHWNLDISKDSGKTRFWKYGDVYEDGPEYYLVDSTRTNDLYSQSEDLLILLGEYFNDIYNNAELAQRAKEESAKEAEEAAKNAEPKVGMTEDEVINGAWGYPDKKNIDEYEWGTHEQWVYEDHGYVYFEDGVVTSVSHR